MMKHFPLLNAEGNSTATAAPVIDATAPISTPISEPVAAVPPPVAPAPVVDKLAPKLAVLTKKEREISRREVELTRREAALLDPRATAKTDPLKAMEMIGLTYEEATTHILNTGRKLTAEDRTAAVEKKLKQMEDAALANAAAAKTAEAEAVKAETLEFIAHEVETAGEAYELIGRTQNAQLVYDVMEQYHTKTGQILSVKEACDHTEKYLDDQLTATLSWKKVQSRIAAKAAPAIPPAKEEPNSPPKTVTLTENMGQAPRVTSANTGLKQLPRDVEIDEALKLLKFTKLG